MSDLQELKDALEVKMGAEGWVDAWVIVHKAAGKYADLDWEVVANTLHQHGSTTGGKPQTEKWRDCPRSDAHRGAGQAIILAFMEEEWSGDG